jgi:hypothetical protein
MTHRLLADDEVAMAQDTEEATVHDKDIRNNDDRGHRDRGTAAIMTVGEAHRVEDPRRRTRRYKMFKDSIYGLISLPIGLVKFIDTPEFQRLRHIKQLAGARPAFLFFISFLLRSAAGA